MVNFTRHILDNGLRVIIQEDHSTPLVAVNIQYFVGSRDEHPDKTGFAHLFEHLMFAGSKHAPEFDDPLQRSGGENNAYTTNDYTTFYEILPAENLETALWLESDRMLALNITKRSFEVQRKVVIEEFKETCLNEPYGDAWHHLSDLMYKVHPYRWPVIGLTPEHIVNAVHDDVKDFYRRWYGPNNAVLVISGKVNTAEALEMVKKWFGPIPPRDLPVRQLPVEPKQKGEKFREVRADVPLPAIFLSFRSPARAHHDFFALDLLSDVLAEGNSSRLYRRLLKEQRLFSSIDAYLTSNFDPGLIVIEGKPAEGVSIESAVEGLWKELDILSNEAIEERELLKIQHRFESTVVFSETSVLNKAQNLAYYEILNRAEWMNEEVDAYLNVTPADMQRMAKETFHKDNAATLVYVPEGK